MTSFRLILTAITALAIAATVSAANPKSDFEQGDSSKRKSSDVRTEWGLTGACYYNDIAFDTKNIELDAKAKLGWGGGLHMAIKFGKFFALQPEINYERTKIDIKAKTGLVNHQKYNITCNSLDIPVLASLRFGNLIRINAGPLFTLMNNCTYEEKDGTKVIFGTTRPTFGYTAGVAVVLFRRYMIDLRYIGYLKPSLCNLAGEDFDCTSKTFSLKIGYVF